MTTNDKRRAAFLAGLGTLTVQECWAWARELDPMVSLAPDPMVPLSEPLMVSVLPRTEHRGLLGSTIIPSVVRRERRQR